MRNSSGVNLGQTTLAIAAQSLKGRGAIELSNVFTNDTGTDKNLFVRSGSRLQGVLGHLSGKKTREAYAAQVCGKLTQVFGNELTAELVRDVRAKIIKTGSLKGDFLAQKLDALRDVHAANKGQKLRIQIGSPMQVRSDCCIAGFASANTAMQEMFKGAAPNPKDWLSANLLSAWGNKDGNFGGDTALSREFHFTGSSLKKLVSLRECGDPAWSQRQPGDMYDLIHQAIGDSTGAIVIEPQPDRVENGVPRYTDDGLREQLRAARDRGNEAANQRVDRVITFVSPDSELLARIQRLTPEVANEPVPPTSFSPPGML